MFGSILYEARLVNLDNQRFMTARFANLECYNVKRMLFSVLQRTSPLEDKRREGGKQ